MERLRPALALSCPRSFDDEPDCAKTRRRVHRLDYSIDAYWTYPCWRRAQRGARGTDAQTGAHARCPTSTRGHRMTVNDLRTNR